MYKKKANIRLFTLFVIPAMFIWITVVLIPFLYGLVITFTDWNGMAMDYNFIGFDNYVAVFLDKNFINSLGKTFVYAFCCVILSNLLGLALALGRGFLELDFLLRILSAGSFWDIFGILSSLLR